MGKPTIPTPRKRGQHGPAYVPTDMLRAKVRAMAGYGIPQPDIARMIDTDHETLRRHYRDELDLGVTQANVRVAAFLHGAATEDSVSAAIYWTKARMGWSDNAAQRELDAKLETVLQQIAALRAERAT